MVEKNFCSFLPFFCKKSLRKQKYVLLLHSQNKILGYGVMVTLQILVLSF